MHGGAPRKTRAVAAARGGTLHAGGGWTTYPLLSGESLRLAGRVDQSPCLAFPLRRGSKRHTHVSTPPRVPSAAAFATQQQYTTISIQSMPVCSRHPAARDPP